MSTTSRGVRRALRPLALTTALLLLVACGGPATPPPTETLVPTPTQWVPPTITPTATPASLPTPTTPPREIVLTAPEEGTVVTSPVEVAGRVSVMPFEANLRGRVYDARGRVVGEEPIQVRPDVEDELGGPGTFAGAIPFQVDAAGPGQVEVAEISARDGSIVVSATVAVTLTTGAGSVPPGEPTQPAPASILDREGAIAHSLNLLREQGIDWGHDNANFAEVRFPDGNRGAFVAVGFSGIAQGYQLLYRVDDGEVVLANFISGPIDWGIWSLQDFETVGLAFPDLFPGEDDGDRKLIQVTGAGHAGTGLWLDGYFELIQITEEGIRVLFSGAHASINANPGGYERHYEYTYEDLDDDGVKEIIQTGEECQLEPGESTLESRLERTDCQPVERVFQFDGVRYVQRADERTPPPDLLEMDVQKAWTSTSPDGLWVARGLAAFPVDGSGPRPLVTRDENLSPDGTLRAAVETIPSRLVVTHVDSRNSVSYETTFEQPEGVHWTSDGQRILIESYTGDGYRVWAVDTAVGEPALVAEEVTFLGTLDGLRQDSTEVASQRMRVRTLPPAGAPAAWAVHELPRLGLRLRAPEAWRFALDEAGATRIATLANFELEGVQGGTSLGDDHIEVTFALIKRPPAGDFTAWLSRTVEMEQHLVTAEPIEVDGRQGARFRSVVSPVSEEVRVLLGEQEIRITRRPISSTQDGVFEQILDGLTITE